MAVNVAITELGNKLDFLGMQDVVFEDQGSRSIAALARFLGVNENTFKGFSGTGKINPTVEMQLAKKLGFSTDWPEWKTGTREQFKQRYQREALVNRHSGERRTGIALRPVYQESGKIWKCETLAALTMDVGQSAGAMLPMAFTVNCTIGYLSYYQVGIRHAFVKTTTSSPEIKTLPVPLRMVFQPENKDVFVQVAGDERNPAWIVDARQGHIGYVSIPLDNGNDEKIPDEEESETKYFCPFQNIAEGDIISISLSVYLKDLVLIHDEELPEEERDAYQEAPARSFSDQGTKPWTGNKKLLADILAGHNVVDEGKGYGVICAQSYKFVDATKTADEV